MPGLTWSHQLVPPGKAWWGAWLLSGHVCWESASCYVTAQTYTPNSGILLDRGESLALLQEVRLVWSVGRSWPVLPFHYQYGVKLCCPRKYSQRLILNYSFNPAKSEIVAVGMLMGNWLLCECPLCLCACHQLLMGGVDLDVEPVLHFVRKMKKKREKNNRRLVKTPSNANTKTRLPFKCLSCESA